MAPYLQVLMARLEDCRAGRIRRLIINLPPRGLKSVLATVAFPARLLGHRPDAHLICVSHGKDLAEKLARDCRRLMGSVRYQRLFATRIARQAVHDISTSAGGGRMATSIEGQLTSRGADFIIIDDPIKADDALSETARPAVNEWFDNTLLSRLNDQRNRCIIIVKQRLHQNDLTGHVLEKADARNWTIVALPAIAEEYEVLAYEPWCGRRVFRRSAGDALHPERESVQELLARRASIGSYIWASQYQQTPIPIGGNLIKAFWLGTYDPADLPVRPLSIVQNWDTATNTDYVHDYSVCTTWQLAENCFFLVDGFREKLAYPNLKRAVLAQSARHNPDHIVIEDKGSGSALIQDLAAEGIAVRAYVPPHGADKQMRLFNQAAEFEGGRIRVPREAPWLDAYLREITGFPGTRHDDQVDSTTQFLDCFKSALSGPSLWAKLAG